MSFDMANVNNALSQSVSGLGGDIQQKMSGTSGGALSETEMLDLQHSLGKWTIMVNMQSNMQKTWADALKAIVSNMR